MYSQGVTLCRPSPEEAKERHMMQVSLQVLHNKSQVHCPFFLWRQLSARAIVSRQNNRWLAPCCRMPELCKWTIGIVTCLFGFNIYTLLTRNSFNVKRECCDDSFNCIFSGTPCSHPVCYFLLCYRFWCLIMWMDISDTKLKLLNQMYQQSVPIGGARADLVNQVPLH